MDFSVVAKNLRKNGFTVEIFENCSSACEYLNQKIDRTTVSFGGSMTLKELGLDKSLAEHNEFWWHWQEKQGLTRLEIMERAAKTEVYLLSANALAETGEIVNIDGNGNRLSGAFFGHEKVYFVIGRNKITKDFDSALWRARNIAAPKNAKRLQISTPCAVKGDHCYDCSSPDRFCNGLSVIWRKMTPFDMEIVLIDEELGF